MPGEEEKKILQCSGSQHWAQGPSGNFKKYWCLNSILKNWCFWTVVLEKTLESPLDCKEIQPVHPKGNQSWIFTGRTDAEAETPIVWLPDMKNWLIGKDADAGKDWRQGEKGTIDDEMVRWHHWSFSWWWTGKLGVLQSMGLQRVRHNWATELVTSKKDLKRKNVPVIPPALFP